MTNRASDSDVPLWFPLLVIGGFLVLMPWIAVFAGWLATVYIRYGEWVIAQFP